MFYLSNEFKKGFQMRVDIKLIAVMFVAMFLVSTKEASALPVGFGMSCTVNGSTSAQKGNPGVLSSDQQTISGGCGSNGATSFGLVQVPVNELGGQNLYGFAQNATANVSARANLGSLGASSNSHADSSPQNYLYTTPSNTPASVDNLYTAAASSNVTSNWWDEITVSGTPGPNGRVVLQFTLDLDGSTSTSLGATASILSRLFIDDGSFNGQILGLGASGTAVDTRGYFPGTTIQVYGDLMAMTGAVGGMRYGTRCSGFICSYGPLGYVAESNGIAEAYNTAGFHIDVLTPGGAYSSLSGQSYLTAVPLPAAAWLFGSGLSGLIGIARRRKTV